MFKISSIISFHLYFQITWHVTFNWPHIAYEVFSINGFSWCSCTSWDALFLLAAEHKRAGGWYGGLGVGGSVYFICKVSEGTQALLHHRQSPIFSLTLYFSVCMHRNLFCISHSSKRTKTTNTFSPLVFPPVLTIFLYTLVFLSLFFLYLLLSFHPSLQAPSSFSVKVKNLSLLFFSPNILAAKPSAHLLSLIAASVTIFPCEQHCLFCIFSACTGWGVN